MFLRFLERLKRLGRSCKLRPAELFGTLVPKLCLGMPFGKLLLPELTKQELRRLGFPNWSLGTRKIANPENPCLNRAIIYGMLLQGNLVFRFALYGATRWSNDELGTIKGQQSVSRHL